MAVKLRVSLLKVWRQPGSPNALTAIPSRIVAERKQTIQLLQKKCKWDILFAAVYILTSNFASVFHG